jgi:hypothetical protein
MKIYYDFMDDNLQHDISDLLQLAVKPKWYKDLSVFIGGFNTAYETVKNYGFFQNDFNGEVLPKTAKLCPSMLHVFGPNSGVIKAPCDIMIRTQGNGMDFVSASKSMTVNLHPDRQLPQLSKKYNILKFNSNVGITVSKNCNVTIMDNILHQETEFRPCPGVIDVHKGGKTLPLNPIAFFKKSEDLQIFEIKKGTVLAVISFSNRVENIVKKDLKQNFRNFENGKSKFVASWKDQ